MSNQENNQKQIQFPAQQELKHLPFCLSDHIRTSLSRLSTLIKEGMH